MDQIEGPRPVQRPRPAVGAPLPENVIEPDAAPAALPPARPAGQVEIGEVEARGRLPRALDAGAIGGPGEHGDLVAATRDLPRPVPADPGLGPETGLAGIGRQKHSHDAPATARPGARSGVWP